MALKTDPYATGVLQVGTHDQLVADIEHIAEGAGIVPDWIWTPMADTCAEPVIDWVRHFKQHRQEGRSGLVLVGNDATTAASCCAAIAGALLRNFVNAKVMTTSTLFDLSESSGVPNPTCLLVPNFFIGKQLGITLSPWRVAMLQDLLWDRHLSGRQTVLYASSLNGLGAEFGAAMQQVIQAHYRVVTIK